VVARENEMAGKLRAEVTRTGGMACVLACLCTGQAFAGQPQEAARPNATSAVAATAAEPAPPPRKRSGFGQAMLQLTQALQDASRQANRPAQATPAAPATSTRPAPAAVGQDKTLAVESPP
jgi:hypothetical protein